MTATAAPDISATISREKLIEVLSAVGAAVPSRATLPVLGNVLIEATGTGLKLTATDLDLTIQAEVAADIESRGAITIPAKRLAAIAKALPPAPVRLRVSNDAKYQCRLLLDCGRAHYKLLGIPSGEFPALPTVGFSGESVRAGELSEVVRRVSFAASTEESRRILNGVLWQRTRQAVRLVATNGHRLAFIERSIDPQLGADGEYIVPTKAFDQVVRLFSADDQLAIGLSEGGHHLTLRSESTSITTRLIEGPYPNYREVIPAERSRSVVVDRVALMSAVKRCLPVASQQTYRLAVTLSGAGTVCLSAITPDVGEFTDEIAARVNGEALTFAINAMYLLDILDACRTDEILIGATGAERAITFQPEGETEQQALFLLMPLRLLD